MSRYSVIVLVCFYLLQCTTGVKVYVEEGFRNFETSFSLPVVDGDSSVDKLIHTLEFLDRELSDKDRDIEMITNFPNLKYINISFFFLHDIPKILNVPQVELLIFEENEIPIIRSNAFSQLTAQEFYFSRNKIDRIEDNSFGVNTTEVILDCNRLTQLTPKWFRNPGGLKSLGLRSNQITYLDSNLLKDFKNLISLTLANNDIFVIGNAALSGPAAMRTLNLQGNKLTNLPPTIFSGSKNKIEYINLAMNRLNFLSRDFLDKLIVKRILLLGNPWQCPCLRRIELWTSHNNISIALHGNDQIKWSSHNPSCIYALSFQETCVEAPDHELYIKFRDQLHSIDAKTYC